MSLLDRLFNFGKSSDDEMNENVGQPDIRFGRYSDNNKTLAKTNQWFQAETLFKDKKYDETIEAIFDYLRDDQEDNVRLVKENDQYTFELFQGTKIVHGCINKDELNATVSLAKMAQASIPVMRRLLDMNYSLSYTRFALNEDKLCMLFDTPRDVASPNKLYYGLKELATKADKQDDLLVSDFATLKNIDDSHVQKFAENEAEVKYTYFKKWIEETVKRIEELNQDSFSGGIGYMLLTLIYKLDFLVCPEGKLLNELESINSIYWTNKEEKTAVERNQMLKDALLKLASWSKDEVLNYFYTAKSTFAIAMPKPFADVADSIKTANENTTWYIENKYNDIALQVMEYGVSYCQYSYSLPKPVTQLFTLFMQINHASFFADLGFRYNFLQEEILQEKAIKNHIQRIMNDNKDRYPKLTMKPENLKFATLIDFNLSFLYEMTTLNFEAK